MDEIKVKQTRTFARNTKKSHSLEKTALDDVINEIIDEPLIGVKKIGDLAGIYILKYKHNANEYLIAYEYVKELHLLTLVSFGSHENFYRDLKRAV